MVRQKTRWLLLRIGTTDEDFPGRSDLQNAVRDNVVDVLGIAAAGAAMDAHGRFTVVLLSKESRQNLTDSSFSRPVRFVDGRTRLALMRMPKEFAPSIRASLLFLHSLQRNNRSSQLIIDTISMHGSARTAKRALIAAVRIHYRELVQHASGQPGSQKVVKHLCRELNETVSTIMETIDF